jgi:hypothetical protein
MYIVSPSAFVGKYINCRNMCDMNNTKLKKSDSKPGMPRVSAVRSHWNITELYYEDVN